ncbi:MATE family efflux transporter [Aliihoeflea sp. 40Bstr573]|uniref:MATE family efflux transporter n=1 Tax=Aliihoeflea sp. 40Bstr573 TaxID=2696467 RepID=UPI0020960BBD|nr:MATE family efflux transporter [Aliihoeflea sp. 40Bstr573]MCO6387538.1 MATE family efflux transporter [Aliihoeflea sp. 40Bstr573]
MLLLAWPMILTNLAQTAMTATDVMMMGRVGPEALAAGTLGSNVYFAPMIFGLGLILATSPMIARELGRRATSVRDVRRTVRQGMWAGLIVAVPIWLLLWQTEAILLAMGQDPALSAQAAAYMRALQWALLPFYWYIVLRSFTSALERPASAMVVMFVAVAFNIVANWALIFGNLGFPSMGIVGAGIATTASSTLMFAGMVVVVTTDRQFRRYSIFGRFWRSDWPRLIELVRLGLPIAGVLALEVSVFNAAALLMGLIDATALAAHAIAIQIASITFMVPMGLGQAATVRVGRAFGANDREGIARAGWTAFVLGVSFMALVALVMLLAPRALIWAFIDLDDPVNLPVVELAVTFLALAALFQIVDGAQAVGGGMLRGLHDTTVPMIYAAIGYWAIGMSLGVVLAFPLGFDGIGIWIGLSVGLAVVAVLFITRWIGRERFLAQPALSPSTSSM